MRGAFQFHPVSYHSYMYGHTKCFMHKHSLPHYHRQKTFLLPQQLGAFHWTLYERSVIETSQSKATTPEDNPLFLKRKRRAASGGTQSRDVLHTRQTLYQLSHWGSSAGQAESLNVMQRQSGLSPDKQVNSISVCITMHMYAHVPGVLSGSEVTMGSGLSSKGLFLEGRQGLRRSKARREGGPIAVPAW